MTLVYDFRTHVANRVVDLLMQYKALLYPTGVVFYIWERAGRLIVAFDPAQIVLERVGEKFIHDLSSRLKGCRVVRTNSRGLFLQVGMTPPPAPITLEAKPLQLHDQPGPWHMPVGTTGYGPLWVSLTEGDSFLIGGSRRKGKSGLTHGFIQALLHGGRTQVHAWDGKGGAEYQGYIGRPNFHFIANPTRGLLDLRDILEGRMQLLRERGFPNIMMNNAAGEAPIEPIALFVDEIAELDDALKDMLKRMVKLYGAAGLYPILATNDPTQAAILVKTNLSTRICLAVPSFQDSLTVLGMKGAEALTERGRGLIIWDGRLTEFQSFDVTFPTPTEEQRRLLSAQLHPDVVNADPEPDPETDQIRQLIADGESDSAIVRKVWGVTGGGSYYKRIEQVKALRQNQEMNNVVDSDHSSGS